MTLKLAITRCVMLAVLMFSSFAIAACNNTRRVSDENIELVTWFIEDIVRGIPRNPKELSLPNSSPEMERLATWLAGTTLRDEYLPPPQVANRRTRWPLLKALFHAGHVVVLDDGTVAVDPYLPRKDQDFALPIVDQENNDRRAINGLLIKLARADYSAEKAWVSMAAKARTTLDTQFGAKRWTGKY